MPAEYVNKLARMFQDIKVSEDLNTEFKEQHRGSPTSGECIHNVCGHMTIQCGYVTLCMWSHDYTVWLCNFMYVVT